MFSKWKPEISTPMDQKSQKARFPTLAALEYGSGVRFGLKFPIHCQDAHSFDISLCDVQFEVPKIDPGELLSSLIA